MKACARSLLVLAALVSTTLAAPTQSKNIDLHDVLASGLTIPEYIALIEGESVEERDLTKRQYNGDTYNQLTDGTACRPISVLYARGTNGAGNVGEAGSEGPSFFNAIAARVGGISRLAIQGVNYPATVLGFLAGGDAQGTTTLFNLINTTASRCPSTKIVVSGYSQGAQLVHKALQRLTAAQAARVNAVVTFGDADRDTSFGLVNVANTLIICHEGDLICENTAILTPQHSNYEQDAPTAAAFVAARV